MSKQEIIRLEEKIEELNEKLKEQIDELCCKYDITYYENCQIKNLRKAIKKVDHKLRFLYVRFGINCEVCNNKINKKYNISDEVFFCSKNCKRDYIGAITSDSESDDPRIEFMSSED